MTSTRTRRLVAAVVVLGVVLAGTAGAVSVASEDVPEEELVGETVTVTVTLEDLYQNPSDEQWYVTGETELRNASWTLVFLDQTGDTMREVDIDGPAVNRSAVDDPDQLLVDSTTAQSAGSVRVRVVGDIPPVEEYAYPELGENGSPESFLALELARDSGTGATAEPIEDWEVTHYTAESREARGALDNASATIEEARAAGLDVSGAEDDFASARSAYENDNFENAVDLAEDAADSAQAALDAQQEEEEQNGGGFPVALVAAVVLLLAVAVGVAVYYSREGDDADTKLR